MGTPIVGLKIHVDVDVDVDSPCTQADFPPINAHASKFKSYIIYNSCTVYLFSSSVNVDYLFPQKDQNDCDYVGETELSINKIRNMKSTWCKCLM